MLDLGKSMGTYQNLKFYGDHENENVYYYFPDEVHLDIIPETGRYDLNFMMFHESKIVDAGTDELDRTTGSILQLGVCCDVGKSRLEQAVAEMKIAAKLPDTIIVTTPLWTDGSTQLITLATSSDNITNDNDDAFVKGIVRTESPSLSSGSLKSLFNVRYDRNGSNLVYSSLLSDSGMLSGVVYCLKYSALRPSVNLKMKAHLSRCQETVKKNIDASLKFTYESFQLGLNANLEWLTQKMEENGDIVIDCVSQADNQEEQAYIDRLVSEFKDSVLQQLFTVSTNIGSDNLDLINALIDNAIPFKIGVTYKFRDEQIDSEKVIEVDYNERKAVTLSHYPQAFLNTITDKISDCIDLYVRKVSMGPLWNTERVEIRLLDDLNEENCDIDSVEVRVWRAKYGLCGAVHPDCFSNPTESEALTWTFDKLHMEPHYVQWNGLEERDVGFYYQVRIIFSKSRQDTLCPDELMSEPVLSYSSFVSIVTNHLIFYRDIPIYCRGLDFDFFPKVEVLFSIFSKGTEMVDRHSVILCKDHEEGRLVIKGRYEDDLKVFVTKIYTLSSGSVIKTAPAYLIDSGVVLFDPCKSKTVFLITVGDMTNVENIIFSATIRSKDFNQENTMVKVIDPIEPVTEIPIYYFNDVDLVDYSVKVLVKEEQSVSGRTILTGMTTVAELNDLSVEMSDSNKRKYLFSWKVPSLEQAGYSSITMRFFNKQEEELEVVKYTDKQELKDFEMTFECKDPVLLKIDKKDLDRRTIKHTGPFIELFLDKVLLLP